jgi:hypothetical protein
MCLQEQEINHQMEVNLQMACVLLPFCSEQTYCRRKVVILYHIAGLLDASSLSVTDNGGFNWYAV